MDLIRRSVVQKDSGRVFGIGSDWRPDSPPAKAYKAWAIWRSSGKTRYPTPEEVDALPDDWISDIHLIEQIAEWIGNNSAQMQSFNNDANKNPAE